MNSSICKSVMIAMLTVLLASATVNAQWSVPSSDVVIIRGGWLFDGISDTRRKNTGIVIRDGRFVEIDANLSDKNLSTARVISLTESETILPGMIDLHAHYNFDLVDAGRAEEVIYNGIIFLATE